MVSITVDASEARTLAADLRRVEPRLSRLVRPALNRSSLAIKNQLQTEMQRSRSFGVVARSISYDISGGAGEIASEIGPVKGSPGSLANIAYFGGANGGGGTVPAPDGALAAEVDNFAQYLAEAAEQAAL